MFLQEHLFGCGCGAGCGVLFEEAPEGDVAEVQGVPVKIEHVGIEGEDAGASGTGRRRNEASQGGINFFPIGPGSAGEEVPQSKGVARTRLGENGIEKEERGTSIG